MDTGYKTEIPDVNEDFSPKVFLLQVKSMSRYLLSKWWKILLTASVVGLTVAIIISFKEPFYTAEVTFALEEEATQKAQQGFVEIGEELGIGNATVDASGALFGSMTNIVELMQSRLLIEKTLRSSVKMNGKVILFADFFLDSLDYRLKWMEGSPYYGTAFNSIKDSLYQNQLISNIYQTLQKKYIKVDRKGKETTLIAVSCNTENEAFSKYFLEALVKEVTNYYTEIKTQRAKTNLVFIEKRMDSIRPAYNGSLYSRAVFMDAHTNPSRQIATVSNEKQQTDVQILKAAYIDLSRSLEAAKIALVRETPLIQYLDVPILPLKRSAPGFLKPFLIFFFAGFLISVLFFFIKRVIQLIMGTADLNPEEPVYYYEAP
jgi:hypothetical protein